MSKFFPPVLKDLHNYFPPMIIIRSSKFYRQLQKMLFLLFHTRFDYINKIFLQKDQWLFFQKYFNSFCFPESLNFIRLHKNRMWVQNRLASAAIKINKKRNRSKTCPFFAFQPNTQKTYFWYRTLSKRILKWNDTSLHIHK